MDKVTEELKKGLKLLKLEWQEDLAQYKQKFLNSSLADKKKAGITWHPVQLKKSKIGMGERLLVEVERSDSNHASSFNSGKSVSFFSTHDSYNSSEDRVNGVINFVKQNTMMVTLQADELPEWMHGSKLGVDLLFDEASYREMEFALKKVISAENKRVDELKDILLGEKAPQFFEKQLASKSNLNFSQNQACELIANAKDVAVVHGPPGTGKTTTLIDAIQDSVIAGESILVCAPSNAAVDLLVEKLIDRGIETLRFGHPARVEEKILNQTLDAKTAFHASYRDLKKLRKETDQQLKIAKQYKRNFGHNERVQRKMMFAEVSRLREASKSLEEYIQYDIYQKTKVFACTLVGASSYNLKGMEFDVVFIDEAAQGLEAATWIPILKAKKVVFAGDHCQLPPTIKSYQAGKDGLAETLFEKVIARKPQAAQMLQVQYRMPEVIMGFSNEQFYKGKLIADERTKTHVFPLEESVIEWIDTAGAGYSDQKEAESLSTFNPEEALFAAKYLNDLVERIGSDNFLQNDWTIGLIAPYGAQVRRLRGLIFDSEDYPSLLAVKEQITIDTVDGFQGQERDLMMISLTRSNEKGEIGFLADTRRMNVALTRAKRKLVLIGDSGTLTQNHFFDELLRYFEARDGYRSVWEFLG
ncbi:AAA domain-containing protein [Algoriphagus aquimarinus]|uniref:Superfamily I DNA and/or RNA helicase n=1 Tax=Algoriphagus aquimarinus TaxID=237018 RepID=A0A1I1BWE9_9BACT|nr:AAA domain-containing protein [Algoriphagus aquimarinus]SFB52653.1 Superfamily I DNA and/or RNA helicase [Algoriphagus aquimarinus]